MSSYLLRRLILAIGVSGVVLALGLFAGAGPAAAAPSGPAVSPSQTPDPRWCAFLLWLTGRDICASLGNTPTPSPPPGPPASQPAPEPPTTPAPTPPPPPPPPPTVTTVPLATTPAPPPTMGAGSPTENPSATVPVAPPPPTAAPATSAPAQALGAPAGGGGGSAPPPATEPPVLATAPIVTSAPLVLHSNPGAVAPDVRQKGPRVVEPEAVPPPYKGNSVVRKVIDSTGPIGRRLVIVAGVLVAVLIGIGAYRLEDRTQLIRRIQEWRHVDDL